MDLTTKENTVSHVYMNWLASENGISKFQKEVKATNLQTAKNKVIEDLKVFVGHGIKESSFNKQCEKLNKARDVNNTLFVMSSAMLKGADLGVL